MSEQTLTVFKRDVLSILGCISNHNSFLKSLEDNISTGKVKIKEFELKIKPCEKGKYQVTCAVDKV